MLVWWPIKLAASAVDFIDTVDAVPRYHDGALL